MYVDRDEKPVSASVSVISEVRKDKVQAVASLTGPHTLPVVHLEREECPIKDRKPLSKIFDHHGGELIIKEHDITIPVPELAVPKGDKAEVQAVASLLGLYKLPEDYDCISVFVWIGSDYRFKKQVKIRIPHFAFIEDPDNIFNIVILTANMKDQVCDENALVLQMHKSVYDYHYEVNDYYCDYYTDHFCSKCVARRRSIVRKLFSLFSCARESCETRESSEPAELSKARVMLHFYVSDNFATEFETTIDLCICYSIKECLKVCADYVHIRKGFNYF